MFILPFLFFVSCFFLLFWAADIFFTVKTVEKVGRKIEANPIIRMFFGFRRRFFVAFKALEIIAFLVLIYFVSTINAEHAVTALLAILFFYLLVVTQGILVYHKAVGNIKPIAVVFFIACLLGIGFAYLNYSTFLNSIEISNALSRCGTKYAELYVNCTGLEASSAQTIFDEIGLNLTIPR